MARAKSKQVTVPPGSVQVIDDLISRRTGKALRIAVVCNPCPGMVAADVPDDHDALIEVSPGDQRDIKDEYAFDADKPAILKIRTTDCGSNTGGGSGDQEVPVPPRPPDVVADSVHAPGSSPDVEAPRNAF